ncbi:P-loop containing nucleoside triphosphate hydrolase protein [Mycena sanguinolenta]|nr:P-loop containing nucleoside triphosphate hydrolase protein [Mycena sanguinolenta]
MEQWTLIVLGDDGVGKNAISLRFAYEEFIEIYDSPPIDLGYQRKQLVVDDRLCLAEVTAPGQDAYLLDYWVRCIKQTFYRAGHGFILMYSVTSRHSFNQLESFLQMVKRVKGDDDPNPILILVGNKCDNPDDEREVPTQEGIARAQQLGCEFFETSAKTGYNVEEVFTSLIRALRTRKNQELGPVPAVPDRPKTGPPGRKRKCHCLIM